jgi:AraC-like DNA-binding protein
MPLRPQTREHYLYVVSDLRRALRSRLDSRDLSLGSIAPELGYCERHVERILAEAGYTWTTFIRELRMTRAAELLLYSQQVKTVAPKVGYRPQHLAEPFVRDIGVAPHEARRIGHLRNQLLTLRDRPLRPADVAARCRTVDRWTRLHREAREFAWRAAPGTPVASALDEALACVPPPRPVPHPKARWQRKRQRRFLGLLDPRLTLQRDQPGATAKLPPITSLPSTGSPKGRPSRRPSGVRDKSTT